MGKGIPAALFMVQISMLLTEKAKLGLAPHEILEQVNNSLSMNNPAKMFATVFCGILDTATGVLDYSNGGHLRPVLAHGDGTVDFLTLPRGMIVGFIEEASYKLSSVKLMPGTTLVAYSDGVTEAENPAQELFSEERLLTLLKDSGNYSPDQVISTIKDGVKAFRDGMKKVDDTTILVAQFLGPQPENP